MRQIVPKQPSTVRRRSGDDFRKAAQIVMARERGDLGVADRKMFNFLLARVPRDQRTDDPVHRVSVSDLLGYLGHSSSARLQDSLARLTKAEIEIDYVSERGESRSVGCHYLSYDMSKSQDGVVDFAFDPILMQFITDPKVFAKLSEAAVGEFDSVWAMKLYEIMALEVNKRIPVWQPTLDEFRVRMALGEIHSRFDNLRVKVIEPAVREVNSIAPFDVTVDCHRSGKGGKATVLRFEAVRKTAERLLSLGADVHKVNRKGAAPRDRNTVDMLDGKTDAERVPNQLSNDVVAWAIATVDEDGAVDAYLSEWENDVARGRRVPDPDRSFRLWLEATLARKREADLSMLDGDTVAALVKQWEQGR